MRRNAFFNRTNNSFTCQPVHLSTLPNHNFELWTLHFELHKGVCFCGFPCSFRNSVSPCGFVPSVHSVLREASPTTPLRMERGVNSTGCKQRGRFFDVKRGSLHCKETPSSNWRRRFFYLNNMPTVGTDALVCPPKHSQEKPPPIHQREGMLPNGMPYKGKWADRRGRLSLHCGDASV